MEDGINGQDQIEVNEKMVSLKVYTIEEFIKFMELIKTNKISYKHKEVFTRKFNDTLKWFHKEKARKDLERKLPPKISNVESCLFDFYKFVNNCGGYEKISQTGEWMEIARPTTSLLKTGSRTSTLKDWVLLKIKEKTGSRTSTPKDWVLLKIKEKACRRISTSKEWLLLKIKQKDLLIILEQVQQGCRPIRDKKSASWVKGTGSHGVLGEIDGTVQVDAGVRERAVGEKGKAGKVVTG
uniref:ARID domain-containing protein n=1 Tax=Tanacetum cinerariifolium TaxID=118510 RepID=A0A6L2L9G7_TANCI|nr:hypothetical protein [Tanacetum cinerariifolium]